MISEVPSFSCIFLDRGCKHSLRGAVHIGDGAENVQFGLSRVFRFVVQSLRLFRCVWKHLRNDVDQIRPHAAAWHIGAALCTIAARFQGHSVLAITFQFSCISIEFDPVDCIIAAAPVFVHCDLLIARNASVWRQIQFGKVGRQATSQLRQLLAESSDCIPGA